MTASPTGLDPVHDGRHALRDLPLERESMPYIISLPEHDIATTIYTWVTKDNVAGAMFAACGPGVGETPIMELADGIDVGPDANFDDWRVGPVHVEHRMDLRTARIRATSDRIQLDARFEALHPAYAYSADHRGCPPWAATDRLEQSGRVTGTLTVDGKPYEFETTGARDHSWGTRNWTAPQHWKWVHAQTAESALHFWQINVAGRDELRGYLVRDGLQAEVETVDLDFELDARCHQRTITARLRDAQGRTMHLSGDYFGHFELPPIPECTLVEGGMRATIDGVPGSGWSEFMWPTDYLTQLRAAGPNSLRVG
jgi:hypothetical protein